jgi:predicted NAD/FAD-dependent oxidoreductase
MTKLLALAILALSVAGCSAKTATLTNDKGESRYCYQESSGAISRVVATREFNKCLNDAGAAGFKRQEEAAK